jgi:hypothetical protein
MGFPGFRAEDSTLTNGSSAELIAELHETEIAEGLADAREPWEGVPDTAAIAHLWWQGRTKKVTAYE